MESLISTGSGDGPEKHKKHRIPRRHHKNEDELDAHVAHVLKRRAKIRRAARGLWAFVKTRKLLAYAPLLSVARFLLS